MALLSSSILTLMIWDIGSRRISTCCLIYLLDWRSGVKSFNRRSPTTIHQTPSSILKMIEIDITRVVSRSLRFSSRN
jgi:hypothetical protein